MERAKAKDSVARLVKEFDAGKAFFRDPKRYDEAKVRAGFIDPFFEALGWGVRLTLQKKREILSKCIYGVDLDPQAVEVAQMSLYLKLLEDEAEETIALQRTLEMWKADKYLPDLSHNLLCGNSLITSQHLEPQIDWTEDDVRRINAFDWESESSGFGKILRAVSEGGHGGFDAVIGNPPYIRVQALTEFAPVEVEMYRRLYKTAAEGNYDIYVPFHRAGAPRVKRQRAAPSPRWRQVRLHRSDKVVAGVLRSTYAPPPSRGQALHGDL